MTIHSSPTPLPPGQRPKNPRQPASLHDLHRRTVLEHVNNGSPHGFSVNRSADMVQLKALSAAEDSSDDDDFPEPIKFSASVKALLEEDGSRLNSSPRREWRDKRDIEGYWRENSRRQPGKQVRIASPEHQARASPLRVVRVGSEPRQSPRSLRMESSFVSERNEDLRETDFVTPAPRTRSVRIVPGSRSTTLSPPASIASANGGSSTDASRIEERSILEDTSRKGQDERSHHRGVVGTLPRTRVEPETGTHGSIRVKRVGKLSGSFLNGPAKRGVLRRQSEEESGLDLRPKNGYDEEAQYPVSEDLIRRQSISSREQSPRYPDSVAAAPTSRTPQSLPIRERSLLGSGGARAVNLASPFQTNSRKHSPIDEGNDSPIESAKLRSTRHLHAPLELPAKNDQENGPPPTFRRVKPQGLDVMGKMDSLYENRNGLERPSAELSPRRPLGKMSNNTPHRPAPLPPPKMTMLETATTAVGASTSKKKRAQISINGKHYTRLDCIGRGGSSRVYRVMADNCKIFALKRVSLENADPTTLAGYKGEIDLLRKLKNVDRVIQLVDWEINEGKLALSVLMQLGESDLQFIVSAKYHGEGAQFDPVFTRFYWKEMLECVDAVHDLGIVHSDLKPANFLLVRGKLKLIDFGISNAIQDHTVNVHREHQTGTPNYMAPEALIDTNAAAGLPGKMMKLGKPSDVWSLGCILYMMVYGKPPFGHIAKFLERIMAIPNPKVPINYPTVGVGNVKVPSSILRTLKSCLQRDQTLRLTVKQLLSLNDPFLYPDTHVEGTVPISQDMLGRILNNVVNHCRARGTPTDDELAGWPAGFFAKIKATVEEDQ